MRLRSPTVICTLIGMVGAGFVLQWRPSVSEIANLCWATGIVAVGFFTGLLIDFRAWLTRWVSRNWGALVAIIVMVLVAMGFFRVLNALREIGNIRG
jgi:hypothetical protein